MSRRRIVRRVNTKVTVRRELKLRTTVKRQYVPSTTTTHLSIPPTTRTVRLAQNTPLSAVPGLVRHEHDDFAPVPDAETGRIYDVFISHASEDKDSFVRQLAFALRDEGLEVWYDEFELRIGDSLRRKIDRGLASSRTGLVVLSPHFFSKGWANYELDGIVTRSVSGDQSLLPIWHNVTKADVMRYSPSLADKVARSTAEYTIAAIAAEIASVILSDKENAA